MKLARLDNLQTMLDDKDDADTLLLCVDAASAIAEQLCKRTLSRRQGRTEYPSVDPPQGRYLWLDYFPIESVTSIKQLYSASNAATFTAAAALTEFTDYVIENAELGRLERLNSVWTARKYWLQAIYTGGFVDPQYVRIALATATWTAATRTLTQVGAFASYTWAAGDAIVINGGTGAATGVYRIASRVSDDAITLASAPVDNESGVVVSDTDLATGDITSTFTGLTPPPAYLRQAVRVQAVWLYNNRDTAGVREIMFEGGGKASFREADIHPMLVKACATLRGRI